MYRHHAEHLPQADAFRFWTGENDVTLPIRAMLFDADGVVQHSSSDDLSARLGCVLGFTPADLDTFKREVFEVERPALTGQADFAELLVPLVLDRYSVL